MEIGRYRSVTSKLVSGLAAITAQVERWLQVPADRDEPALEIEVDGDWSDGIAIDLVSLLRRVRLHAVTVVVVNEACNAHSLAVQMRSALECAGQVALIFHNLVLEPKQGLTRVLSYLDWDYYETTIRSSKGVVGHEQLLEQLASIRRNAKEDVERILAEDLRFGQNAEGQRRGGGRTFDHIDKVADTVITSVDE